MRARSAFGPLLLAILGLMTLSELGVGALLYDRLRAQLEGDLSRRLVQVSQLLALDVDAGLASQFRAGDEELAAYRWAQSRLETRARAAGVERAYVVDLELRVRVDSEPRQLVGDARTALLANRLEAARAAAGDASPTRLYRDERGRLRLSAFAPLRASNGTIVALLGVDASPAFFEPLAALRRQMLFLGALGVGIAGLAGVLLVAQVGRRLERLRRITTRAARGDLTARPDARGADAIGALGRELDGLIASIVATRDYYEAVLGSLDVGLLTTDGRGEIRLANPSALRLLGITAPSLVGQPLAQVLAHEPALAVFVARALDGPLSGSSEIALAGGLAGGGRVVAVSVSTLRESAIPPGFSVSLLDITELRRLEQRARHNERLAALGGMAGGLLHEIRNPLAAMTVYLDVLRGRAGDAETREILERTLGEAERLNGFLADFQVFAGGKPLRRESVAADAVVDAAARAVRFPAPVRLVRALAADAAFDADRPLLVHAIRNLLQNAVDAMAGAAGEIRISAERAGPDVVLSVGDDGPGIPAEQRERVLEPMFTTRPGGIGLGLTIVERVVQAHGGTLELDVSPAGGALFRMRLPAAPEEAAR